MAHLFSFESSQLGINPSGCTHLILTFPNQDRPVCLQAHNKGACNFFRMLLAKMCCVRSFFRIKKKYTSFATAPRHVLSWMLLLFANVPGLFSQHLRTNVCCGSHCTGSCSANGRLIGGAFELVNSGFFQLVQLFTFLQIYTALGRTPLLKPSFYEQKGVK